MTKDSGLSDWKGGVTVFLRLAAGATVWGECGKLGS